MFGISVACLSLTAACHFGMTAKKFPPAQGPQGVTMRLSTAQGEFSGELIEVREAGIVILSNRKLQLLPYVTIYSSEADNVESHYTISQGHAPEPDVREYLRLLSRFPQGLTPELLQQLLQTCDQTDLLGTTP